MIRLTNEDRKKLIRQCKVRMKRNAGMSPSTSKGKKLVKRGAAKKTGTSTNVRNNPLQESSRDVSKKQETKFTGEDGR